MESRVGELDLRVRAPAGRADAVVPIARDFVCRVLERCDALLEERAPGRLVFMRRLEMQWRVWQRALESGDEVEAVAAELARALDEDVRARTRSSDESGEIAVFSDEVHYRTEYLRAVSRQRAGSCWFFAPLLDEGPPPGLLVMPEHRVLAEAVVLRLAADGLLEDVLSELPATGVAGLAEALGVAEPTASPRRTSETLSPAQQVLAAFVQRGTPLTRTSTPETDGRLPTADRSVRADLSSTPTAPKTDRAAASVPLRQDHADVVDTRFGGLFYLLAPALELSIGEALWCGCVSEAAVFARIADALLGPKASDDPAPRLFAGSTSPTGLTAVAADQHAEISTAIVEASIAALTRDRATALPSLHVSVEAGASGRFLAATAFGSPFALFAWPAHSHDALREGLAALLARWPANAPVVVDRADTALASFDRTGRISTTRAVSPRPWLLPHDDPYATALLTQAAGSLAYLFASRAGAVDITAAAGLVERHLAVPARIVVTDEALEVRIPMDRIDLAVRRAGLDRDPGWVPWLQKRVTFVFSEESSP